MPRLVRLVPRDPALAGAQEKDDFSTRLTKYVPVEVAGPFPIIDNALTQIAKEGPHISTTALVWVVFVILFFLNLGYLWRKAPQPGATRLAATTSCIGSYTCRRIAWWRSLSPEDHPPREAYLGAWRFEGVELVVPGG